MGDKEGSCFNSFKVKNSVYIERISTQYENIQWIDRRKVRLRMLRSGGAMRRAALYVVRGVRGGGRQNTCPPALMKRAFITESGRIAQLSSIPLAGENAYNADGRRGMNIRNSLPSSDSTATFESE